jgi:hypothetical protein
VKNFGQGQAEGPEAWTAARCEANANDQGARTSLVAVTARSNRFQKVRQAGVSTRAGLDALV